MLDLSSQYGEATTQAEKDHLVAAGEAMLATYEGTRFHLNYILGGTLVPALLSIVMLQSNVFGRPVAYIGIFAAILNLGLYLPASGLVLSVFSGLAFLVWYVMLGMRFHVLSRPIRMQEASE
jgi:hypothetical protein